MQYVEMSNLAVLVLSTGCTAADGHGSYSVHIQRRSVHIRWSQGGSGAAQSHSSPSTALSGAAGRLGDEGDRGGTLDGGHRCCGPILTVTSCSNKDTEHS